MGRIIAFDIGKKRIGIAVSDPMKIIATGLKTVDVHEIWQFLDKYFEKEQIDKMVVGFPKQLNNEASESMIFVEKFIEKWILKFPNISFDKVDERFTSKMAFNSMIENGIKKSARRDKAEVDVISATIILQDYMRTISNR